MLVIILGNLGSGKTLIMTILALIDNKLREIWSNYKINSKRYNQLDVVDLLDLKDNIIILMDEAYAWIESRVSSSTLNEYLSSILFHTRKSNTDIYLTTPMFSTIDKRFRHQSNFIVFCKHRNDFENDDFHFIFYDKDNNTYGSITLTYFNAMKYFRLYDTYEKVESHRKRGLEFNILKKYPIRLGNYVRELSKEIEKEINKITHDSVKSCLFNHGIDLAYESLIYIHLKGKKYVNNKDN